MRTTKAEVEAVFKLWVVSVNGHVAANYKDEGGYRLDHNSVYGGWEIERICNVHGGVDTPFLTNRLTAYYFVQAMRAGMRTLEQMRLNTKQEVSQ